MQIQQEERDEDPFSILDQRDDPLLQPASPLLEIRQSQTTNTTSNVGTTDTTDSEPATPSEIANSSDTGSVGSGGNATLTENGCAMTTHLQTNQQASWSHGIVNTCCGDATGSTCYYRIQSTVSGTIACEIPSCTDLQSEDQSLHLGFKPLTSTNGKGKWGNVFPSFGMMSGAVSDLFLSRTSAAFSLLPILALAVVLF
ncbi:hypothetical protein IE53DRAFT_321035 [Violaceomyces palustris]|uniref:Uncharacterized protein n=1 Tax=Violaceomyces palustris TaxID=1673888 RepID=A0ACD0NP00_9BASI|nr:hypothetical protein IE53DRAFT_321035 [Violaceomyces palustris]